MRLVALRESFIARPFFYLLVSLSGVFVMAGWISEAYPEGQTPSLFVRVLWEILTIAVLVSGPIALIKQQSAWTRVVIVIAGFSVLAHLARLVFPADNRPSLWIPAMVIDVIFQFVLSGMILATLLHARRVTVDMILGAVAIYFLLAISWGYIYAAIEIGTDKPNLLVIAGEFERKHIFDCMYFSFTTMTTLGYGDITPKTGYTRALAVVQAVVGQVYLAVLVARLVGMQVAQSMESRESE